MGNQVLPEGLDFSRWNPGWKPEISISRGIKFAVNRITVGDYYVDKTYEENYAKASQYSLPYSAYHVVKPSISAVSQMNYSFNFIKKYPAKRIVLDIEVHDKETPAKITDVIYGCIMECVDRGHTPVIYTSAGFWNYYVLRRSFWKNYPLWVANYGVAIPTIPVDWQGVGWKLWQYSADGNYLGSYYGVDSRHVDVNKFNGSLEEMYQFFNSEPIVSPPDPSPSPEPEQDYINAYLWRTLVRLNIRSKPNTSSNVVRTIPSNTIVEEVERITNGNDTWIRVGNSQYCAVEYNNNKYLTPVYKEN